MIRLINASIRFKKLKQSFHIDYVDYNKLPNNNPQNMNDLREKFRTTDIIVYIACRLHDIEKLIKLRKLDISALEIPVEDQQELFYELFLNEDFKKKVFVLTFQSSSLISLNSTDMVYFFSRKNHCRALIDNMKTCKQYQRLLSELLLGFWFQFAFCFSFVESFS